jgi:hypothetical protein
MRCTHHINQIIILVKLVFRSTYVQAIRHDIALRSLKRSSDTENGLISEKIPNLYS